MKGDMNSIMWMVILFIIVILLVALFYFYGYNEIKSIITRSLFGQ